MLIYGTPWGGDNTPVTIQTWRSQKLLADILIKFFPANIVPTERWSNEASGLSAHRYFLITNRCFAIGYTFRNAMRHWDQKWQIIAKLPPYICAEVRTRAKYASATSWARLWKHSSFHVSRIQQWQTRVLCISVAMRTLYTMRKVSDAITQEGHRILT